MALTQKFQIRQSQALVMTPQLMQAIKLLQLSNLDLIAYVEAELERNPLLERSAKEGEAGGEPDERHAGARGPSPRAATAWQEVETSRSHHRRAARYGLENVFPDDAGRAPPRTTELAMHSEWAASGHWRPRRRRLQCGSLLAAEATLGGSLAEQMALPSPIRRERLIGQYLIDLVDEAGYLGGDLAGLRKSSGRRSPRSRRC